MDAGPERGRLHGPSMPRVDISNGGRAGTVTYREGRNSARFDWEFALSPVLAVVSGPPSAAWDRLHPWAAGRQEEVLRYVAGEVVRQRAAGCTAEIDVQAGTIHLLEARRGKPARSSPRRGPTATEDPELEELVGLVLRDEMSGPVVDALARIDHPRARAAVEEAAHHHLSVEVRLAAAEALHARGALPDLAPVLVRELEALNRPGDGLARMLRLAAAHPTPAVRQALLRASWNQTECAAELARLLLRLQRGQAGVEALAPVLPGLGLHVSHFQRKSAFEALCRAVGMSLDG